MDINSSPALDSMPGATSSLPGFLPNSSASLTGLPGENGQNPSSLQFVQGVNFNGRKIAFGNDVWLSQADARRKGLTLSAHAPVQSDLITDTSVGQSFRDMLNSGIQADSSAGDKDLTVTQVIDNGTYQVDLFMTAPKFQARRFDITLEGTTVDQVTLNANSDGRWTMYSYEVTVNDGALDLVLEKAEKSPLLSGLRISSVGDAIDSTAAVSPPATVVRPPTSQRSSAQSSTSDLLGINFNGGAIAYSNNERWLSQQQALQNGLTLNAYDRITTDAIVDSSISTDVRNMLSSGIQASSQTGEKDLEISQTLDNGDYWVDLFIASPTQRERVFEINIEGNTLEQVTLDEDSDGTWNIYSYKVAIEDGELNVVLDKTRKSPIISGMRVSPVAQGDNTPFSPAISDTSSNLSGRQSVTAPDSPARPAPDQPTSTSRATVDPLPSPDAEDSGRDDDSVGLDAPALVDEPRRSNPLPLASNPTKGRLVWTENFGPNWENTWPGFKNTSAPENRRVIDDPTGQFEDVLRVSYRNGGVGPSDGTQFKVFLDQPMQSATLEYYLRFKPGFLPVRGGKLPGFVGGELGRKQEFTGGRTPTGLPGSGWSSRLGFRPAQSDPNKVILRAYTYLHKGQQDPKQDDRYVVDAFGNEFRTARQWNFGTTTPFLDPDTLDSELIIQTGEWYKVSLQVTLNTPGQKNGFIKGFIQEPGSKQLRLAMHVPNLSFQKKGANLPIDRMFFSTFFGGSADSYRAKRSEYVDYAGFKIYDNSN